MSRARSTQRASFGSQIGERPMGIARTTNAKASTMATASPAASRRDVAWVRSNMLKSSLMARELVLLVAAIVSFGVVVAASADPPDPTWIAGFWDDDDQDTAVSAVLSIPGWPAPADSRFAPFLIVDPLCVIPTRPWIKMSAFAVVESRG